MIFSAEILGRVPNGLTHNDVYASVVSMVSERTILESHSKRRLAGNMISVGLRFHALNENEAKETLRYAYTGVTGFSADVIGPREIKS